MRQQAKQTDCDEPTAEGTPVRTACNSLTHYTTGMACAPYHGQKIYFCLPLCKKDFEQDPVASCLASRLEEFE